MIGLCSPTPAPMSYIKNDSDQFHLLVVVEVKLLYMSMLQINKITDYSILIPKGRNSSVGHVSESNLKVETCAHSIDAYLNHDFWGKLS